MMAQADKAGAGTGPVPLAGKIAVVVGGGRGIGRAVAHKLASEGATVIVAARTASELEAVVAETEAKGGQVVARVLDVLRPAEVEALAGELRQTHGRVDVLVNSMGVSLIAPLDSTPEEDWDLVIDTNLKGPYLCTRAMLDLLRASDGGQVVNIASKVGLTGYAQVTAYTAAKAGLIGFGRALAQELSTENIRVLTVCPGPVDTPMRWAATPKMDPGLAISAETVAETILFLVTLDSHVAVNSEIVIEAIAYDESAVPLD
jgi:NAD(P)-dependent dehydrogenase (short-subunit alcohol dehydrogenase family)